MKISKLPHPDTYRTSINAWRAEKGVSTAELARRAGISRAWLSNWLNHGGDVLVSKIEKVLAVIQAIEAEKKSSKSRA